MAANVWVRSRHDYCNSLFRRPSPLDLHKLQCVKKSLVRIVTYTSKYSHITPVRKSLHWLPMEHRSILNTALLVYKFLHSGYPKYFVHFLIPKRCVYNTHTKAKLMVCCLRFITLPLQYISLPSILASAFLMMLKRFGMICLMMHFRPLLSTHSDRRSKSISLQKHIHCNFCFSQYLYVGMIPAMPGVNDYNFCFFYMVCLESVFRWT